MAEKMSIGKTDIGRVSLDAKGAIQVAPAVSTTKPAFCAACGEKTAHAFVADANGETVVSCACGRFHKYPKGLVGAALDAALAEHEEANS